MPVAVTTPGLSYGLDGKHNGPGPWLSVVREINARTDGAAFGTPVITRDSRGYVETYPDYEIVMIGKFQDQRVTIIAYPVAACALLIEAAESLGLTAREV
jgi:hypothetical protein